MISKSTNGENGANLPRMYILAHYRACKLHWDQINCKEFIHSFLVKIGGHCKDSQMDDSFLDALASLQVSLLSQ